MKVMLLGLVGVMKQILILLLGNELEEPKLKVQV